MPLIPLFLRREPAIDPASLAMERAVPGSTRRLSTVAIYRDAGCTEFMGRFPPNASRTPRKSSKFMNFNCWRYSVQWVHPLPRASQAGAL